MCEESGPAPQGEDSRPSVAVAAPPDARAQYYRVLLGIVFLSGLAGLSGWLISNQLKRVAASSGTPTASTGTSLVGGQEPFVTLMPSPPRGRRGAISIGRYSSTAVPNSPRYSTEGGFRVIDGVLCQVYVITAEQQTPGDRPLVTVISRHVKIGGDPRRDGADVKISTQVPVGLDRSEKSNRLFAVTCVGDNRSVAVPAMLPPGEYQLLVEWQPVATNAAPDEEDMEYDMTMQEVARRRALATQEAAP